MVDVKYKTFWHRFWAGWIDSLVLWPLDIPDLFIMTPTSPKWLIALWLIFSSVASLLYSIVMHGWRGQTVGKMVLGIKVVDISERPLTMKQAVLRDSVGIVMVAVGLGYLLMNFDLYLQIKTSQNRPTAPTLLWVLVIIQFGWFLLELITMLMNDKRRALHDFIAGSVVIKLYKNSSQQSGISEV